DLSKQIKRAINSVGLNSGEGLYARGGNRTTRIESAMNSGREVILGLRISGAAGYLERRSAWRVRWTPSIGSSPHSTTSPTARAERKRAAGVTPAALSKVRRSRGPDRSRI